MRRLELKGQTFGRLTVIRGLGTKAGRGTWLCACACGGEAEVTTDRLRSGKTASCGCVRRETLSALRMKHGATDTPEYGVWLDMRRRCRDRKHSRYYCYGARGVQVCERWGEFANFIADMGPRPSAKHSIERDDNDGDYTPENCRWATLEEQANNKRRNVFVTWDGKRQTVAQWAREIGMKAETLRARLLKGWSAEQALFTPVKGHR